MKTILFTITLIITLSSCSKQEVNPNAKMNTSKTQIQFTVVSTDYTRMSGIVHFGLNGMQKVDTLKNDTDFNNSYFVGAGDELNVNAKTGRKMYLRIEREGKQTTYDIVDGQTFKVKF